PPPKDRRTPCAFPSRPPPATPACRSAARSSPRQDLEHLPKRCHIDPATHPDTRTRRKLDLDHAGAPRSRSFPTGDRDRHQPLIRSGPTEQPLAPVTAPAEQLVGVHVMPASYDRS